MNPIEGFDMVKAAYTRKRKDAERRGDEVTADRVGYEFLVFIFFFFFFSFSVDALLYSIQLRINVLFPVGKGI